MKALLFTFSFVVLSFYQSKGQSFAFSNAGFVQKKQLSDYSTTNSITLNTEHRHIPGTGGLEVGAIMFGAGGAILLAGYSSTQPFNSAEFIGATLAGVGLDVLIVSGIVYLVNSGRNNSHHHYTITGSNNHLGIAYNFR